MGFDMSGFFNFKWQLLLLRMRDVAAWRGEGKSRQHPEIDIEGGWRSDPQLLHVRSEPVKNRFPCAAWLFEKVCLASWPPVRHYVKNWIPAAYAFPSRWQSTTVLRLKIGEGSVAQHPFFSENRPSFVRLPEKSAMRDMSSWFDVNLLRLTTIIVTVARESLRIPNDNR